MFKFNPYALLAAAGIYIGSVVGGALFWGHHVSLAYKVQIAGQEAKAQALKAKAAVDAAAKERDWQARVNDLEAQRDKALQDSEAASSDFQRRLADSVRAAAARARRGCVPQTPGPAGTPADSAAGSDDGHGLAAVDAGRRLKQVIDSLKADVVECVGLLNTGHSP